MSPRWPFRGSRRALSDVHAPTGLESVVTDLAEAPRTGQHESLYSENTRKQLSTPVRKVDQGRHQDVWNMYYVLYI